MLPPPSARAFQGSAPSTGTHTSASLLPSPPLPVQPFSHCHPSQDAQAEPKAAKSRGKLNQQRFLIQPGSLVARVRGGVCSELLGFPLIFPWARHGAREAEGDHEGRAQHPTHPPPPPPHPRHPPTPPPPSPTPPPPAVSVKKLQPWHLPAGEELWALPQTHLETSGAYSLSPLPTISYPSGRSKAQQGNATPGNAHPWSQARVARSRWRLGQSLCKVPSIVQAWQVPGGN